MESFKYERVKKINDEIFDLRTIQTQEVINWEMKEGFFLNPEEAENSQEAWASFNTLTDRWGGLDKHFWFKTKVTVPSSFDKKSFWINFCTQTAFWDAINPQFLAFVNGVPVQGVDINHREIKLSDCANVGEEYIVELQAYAGRDLDSVSADYPNLKLLSNIVEIDQEINRLYYNIQVPNRVVSYLEKGSYSRIKLEKALEKAINLIDLRAPLSPEFYASVEDCNLFIEDEIYNKLAGNDEVIATCIGHTHIDIAWWWTVEQTKEKVARSFSTVLRLMDEFPEYKFMSSQPQLYAFVKERYPDVFEKIKARVAEGRWEVEGGMWLEADCNLCSGESLVRQFLHGKKFFKDEFNKDNKVLWLPDVFGYSAALPQIMKKSGIEYFMTTKIAWSQFNKLPMDTFWWKGIDGSEIFTHLITSQSANQPKDSYYTTYSANLEPVTAIRAWDRYQQKDCNNDVLIAFGHGDGGGGPTREMLEMGKRLTNGIIGTPKVRFDFVGKYFEELKSKVEDNKDIPKWVGELYLEYHRGTYTTMARNKRSNRKGEFLLQDGEFFDVLASTLGKETSQDEIFKWWETLLLNQFHDILPGTSIKEVYDVTKMEYAALDSAIHQIINDKIDFISSSISSDANSVISFNTLSFDRNDVVTVDAKTYSDVTYFADENNNIYPVQLTADKQNIMFSPENVPAKGFAVFTPINGDVNSCSKITFNNNVMDTPYYTIKLNENGEFTSIFDKEADRELIKNGMTANVLRAYEDKPLDYDNWDIEIYYKQKSWVVNNLTSMELTENGAVRTVLKIKRKFLDSTIIQNIIFYPNNRRIDFESYVDWKQHQLLLKCEFPVDINSNQATYDIQFGNLTRNTHENTSWDAAKFEVCGHKWADLSEKTYGVALLNDCKYGYGIIDGNITLSLVKSGILPNPKTDQEEHFFTYSLMPHMGDFVDAGVQKEAYCLNIPQYNKIVTNEVKDGATVSSSLVSLDKENVFLEVVKTSVDKKSVILRMHEAQNTRTNLTVSWNGNFKKFVECDMMENEIETISENSNTATFNIKPFEIKTFKVIL